MISNNDIDQKARDPDQSNPIGHVQGSSIDKKNHSSIDETSQVVTNNETNNDQVTESNIQGIKATLDQVKSVQETSNLSSEPTTGNVEESQKLQQTITVSKDVYEQMFKAKNIQDDQLLKAKRDLESMVLKYAKSERENLQNQRRVDELEKKLQRILKDNEQLAYRIRILTNEKNQLNDTLSAKVAQLTVLDQKKSQLDNVQCVKFKETEQKLLDLEAKNVDLLKKIEVLKTKEGETLDFCEMASMKLVLLQTDLDEALAREPKYKINYEKSIEEIDKLKEQNKSISEELESLKYQLDEGAEKLQRVLAQKDDVENRYKKRVDELENEIKVMNRKHKLAAKELNKEVRQYRELMVIKD